MFSNILSRMKIDLLIDLSRYHANTDADIKLHISESMRDVKGKVRLLICTTAFGMGVDCKGLHRVIHFGPPSDVDDYIQETGRIGRDGVQSSLAGSKLSPHMRVYLANTEICRREILLKSFGQQKQDAYSEAPTCALHLALVKRARYPHIGLSCS